MKLTNLKNLRKDFSQDIIKNKKRENNTIEYIEKFNSKCEINIINNPFEKFSLYKSSPEKQYIFSLLSELNTLEELFISNFIKEMKRKTENEIREFFPKKKKEYEDRIELLLDKAKKELIKNQEIVSDLKEKNSKLKDKLLMMKNHKRLLNEKLEESDNSINMLKKKHKLYSQIKESYEHFSSGFNQKDQKENQDNRKKILDILNEFNTDKKYLTEVKEELKEKKAEIFELKQNMIKEEIDNRNSNYKLYNEFFNLEKDNKIIEEQNKKKLLNIKEDIIINNLLVKENEKIQKSFISVFNLFYKDLNLERNLIKNPKNIDLIKSDYIPKTFIIEEVVNYIYLMLQNSTEESCFELLKDIVSYIYMILRETGGGINKMKYEPVLAVNEIEKNLIAIQNENATISDNIINIENKIIEENELIDKLNKQIENIKNIQEELQKSMKLVYFNRENKNIRKSLSATSFKPSDNIKKQIKKTQNKFENIKKKIDNKFEEEKVPFFKENLDNLINRINRLYFYRMKDKNYKENYSFDRYSNVKRRMNQKLNRLKKLKKYNSNFLTVEGTISNNINRNIDKLILTIQNNYNN